MESMRRMVGERVMAVCGGEAAVAVAEAAAEEGQRRDQVGTNEALLPWQRMAASCTGAVLTSLMMTPLDVAKVRLQAQSPTPTICVGSTPASCSGCSHYTYNNGLMEFVRPKTASRHVFSPVGTTPYLTGTIDALTKIVRYEGMRSLYNGLAPTLVLSVPATMLYFSLYDEMRLRLELGPEFAPYAPLVAGGVARTIAVTSIAPLELIRTQMQASSNGKGQRAVPKGILPALRANVAEAGMLSLWRGLAPSLYRDVPFSAVYWFGYERIRAKMLVLLAPGEELTVATAPPATLFTAAFAAGSVAGMLAAAVTHPFDVAKTRRQIEMYMPDSDARRASKVAQSTFQLLADMVAKESVASLYTGILPRLAKIAPACAIMISSYELGKHFFAVTTGYDDAIVVE
ncbi:solute carrier family 25 member 40 [Thecamonas trahens ATCC 50062]|uniref:Solute carrier family 25 member 40 n=1 Tax=Thecamonas trahens ATCC 50062 TaxID=461836 RepID=A0A0L0DGQ5_THETB|nr:solute carrier family 25 member 40 [Thecamonas trahens ATCC 50062]KNC51375.1 solute carrier family 25 member 40 [Thecamonas trahens ATCC 50062]|eukprot:XP_013756293.1 solute carrier family 25 member 40 [Thecamonas trahens ATCC 50062]